MLGKESGDIRILRCDNTEMREAHRQVMIDRKMAAVQQAAVKITEIMDEGGVHDVDPAMVKIVEKELSKASEMPEHEDKENKMP